MAKQATKDSTLYLSVAFRTDGADVAAALDEWRRKHPLVPSRARAVKLILRKELGLPEPKEE